LPVSPAVGTTQLLLLLLLPTAALLPLPLLLLDAVGLRRYGLTAAIGITAGCRVRLPGSCLWLMSAAMMPWWVQVLASSRNSHTCRQEIGGR
jgi:hypothetical protein